MKGSHPRPADRCPFVLRHSRSQVTSFMQLGMLWFSTELPWCRGGVRYVPSIWPVRSISNNDRHHYSVIEIAFVSRWTKGHLLVQRVSNACLLYCWFSQRNLSDAEPFGVLSSSFARQRFFFKSNRLPQFSSDLFDICLECASGFCRRLAIFKNSFYYETMNLCPQAYQGCFTVRVK